jgi:hypothetical protein
LTFKYCTEFRTYSRAFRDPPPKQCLGGEPSGGQGQLSAPLTGSSPAEWEIYSERSQQVSLPVNAFLSGRSKRGGVSIDLNQ